MENRYIFRRIRSEELPEMFDIILERVKWMDETGIKQWNVTGYAEVYPLPYYEEKHEKGEVFVLEDNQSGKIVCAAVLRNEDERWDHVCNSKDGSALYLHNFASRVSAKDAGSIFLDYAEKYAASEGKQFFRLDSADDNEFLTRYYSSRGYVPAGSCVDGPYTGILREKKL